jgi:DNA-binding beta-propeller fold protein YncE
MPSRTSRRLAATVVSLLSVAGVSLAQRASSPPSRPGYVGGGVTLLPNGWRIAPAGRHITNGDLPLNMALSPDGKSLIVTNNGYMQPTLRVVDIEREMVSSVVSLTDAWLGLAWHPDGRRLFSSGAASNSVLELSWANSQLKPSSTIPLARGSARPAEGINRPAPTEQSFIGGVAVSPDGARLYGVHVFGQVLSMVDLASGLVRASIDLPAEPYTCLVSPDGSTVFVSLWGGAKVLLYDAKTLASKGEVAVGEHPNAMTITADGKRLFVACANTNAVWVVDPVALKAIEQISMALFPNAPNGSTPNAVALSPDGSHLAVANADNNTVAYVDISAPDQSRVSGFIPTGWYPTGVLFSKDGSQMFVLSGKGLTSLANPRGAQPGVPAAEGQYSGSMLQGSLSILKTPDADTLQRYTQMVYALTPYTDASRLAPVSAPAASPIPRRVGDASPIKHVFYIIRENRTYDQILGDLEKGNGDPTLALFGDNVTPNAHALAREFVTLDNFYVDAEVSYDGHAFSTGAYASDFVEKIWPINYGGRGGAYLSEGTGKMRNAYGNITAPQNGYVWDACIRANKTIRSYGEFAHTQGRNGGAVASVPGLEGRVSPTYAPWDLKISDNKRVDAWLAEFQAFEVNGQVPALSILRLGNDHTSGTKAGYPTPRAMIAENDQALGRIIETISKSKYWNDSAIFVLEDDAQNGPDHVDAHRSPAFVASPFVARGTVDSTLYTTSGMLRTMELILGLPPMSQYDAAATPMYGAFQTSPVLTPFARKDARVKIDEMNRAGAAGSAASALMNFEDADMTPELQLNEILWMSVHGLHSVMPPPVHAAFVRPRGAGAKDKDDDK